MSASTGAVIQQYVPALAETLGRLRRTPGRGEGWVESVWSEFETADPEGFGRARRRIGFARRLAEMADIRDEEAAAATIGTLFAELISVAPEDTDKTTTSRAWSDYLLRNIDWLAPAFSGVEALGDDDWETADTDGSVLARIVAIFDGGTAGRNQRPMQVLQHLLDSTPSPAVARIVPVLWSEQGQELCDKHFRRPGGYSFEAKDLKRSFELLKNGQARTILAQPTATAATERAVTPMQWSGAASPRNQPKSTRPSVARRTSPAGNNFERRRQALRSGLATGGRSHEDLPDEPEHEEEHDWHPDEHPADEPIAREQAMAPKNETPDIDLELAASLLRRKRTDDEPHDREEEPARPARETAHTRLDRNGGDNVGERLEELRSKFEQIQRAAAAGERLLAELSPQLDDLASWISDIEAVIGRHRRGGERVA